LTSITDILAFLVGSAIDLPAVSDFCIAAAFSVGGVFFLQFTFFTGFLVLDERRLLRREPDCCLPICLLSLEKEKEGEGGNVAIEDTVEERKHADHEKRGEGESYQMNDDDYRKEGYALDTVLDRNPDQITPGESFICTHIGGFVDRFLSDRKVQAVLLVFFLSSSIFGAYAVSRLEKGLNVLDFIPADSYVASLYAVQAQYFVQTDTTGSVMQVMISQADYESAAGQSSVIELQNKLKALPYALPPVSLWLEDFQLWCNSTQHVSFCPGNSTNVASFLSSYAHYKPEINIEGAVVKSSRMQVNINMPSEMGARLDLMRTSRGACASVSGLTAFPFEWGFLWFERYAMIDEMAFRSLLAALIGVSVILSFFLPLIPAALVTLTVGMVDLNVMGLMYLWSIPINIVSLINLIMVVGFAVDYSAHVAEAYVKETGSAIIRMKNALVKVGVSVLHGGISTFLAVCVLSFSTSGAMLILFKMFFGLVVFGLLHGLLFLPIVLSLVPAGAVRAC